MGLKKNSAKIGFTELEAKVLLFLLIVFISGFVIKNFFSEKVSERQNFDYSKQDSLFFNTDAAEYTAENPDSVKDKTADYKQGVLALKKPDFNSGKTDNLPEEKSININKADAKLFSRLPGIGHITAEKIIDYRKVRGRFKKLEDLLNVKGIGNSKFSKIKKYLYIEE